MSAVKMSNGGEDAIEKWRDITTTSEVIKEEIRQAVSHVIKKRVNLSLKQQIFTIRKYFLAYDREILFSI